MITESNDRPIALTLNGQRVETREGTTLLTTAQSQGIKIPTLCHHPALTPYGACRLCVVEVRLPGGSTSIQASCSYPASEGLEIQTDTPRVQRARKIMAELLLARCPGAPTIRKIAADLGVGEPRIRSRDEDCIECGLCVRMCEERMGRNALGFSGRGSRRKVEPPYGKQNEMCWTCGACIFVCPTQRNDLWAFMPNQPAPIPHDYNMGLMPRPAIHLPYPQGVPDKPALDPTVCVHMQHGACGICKAVCGPGAIDYEQEEKTRTIEVGAIILAPGYESYDPRQKTALGYGRHRNVVTSLEFERILSASGPSGGKVRRLSDEREPERVAFIQCVGSREADRDYCSSVCCMYATKQALIAMEHAGENLKCDIFYMDLRAYGKGFEQYYQRAQSEGVTYIRARPALIDEIPESKNLLVHYLAEGERKTTREYDIVVLSTGIVAPCNAATLAETCGIELRDFDFCRTSEFAPVDTSRPGVFASGAFVAPQDIPETVMQASAASSRVLALLKDARGTLIQPRVEVPERDVTGRDPRVGVFVCHCGSNIAGVVDVPDVVAYARTLPDVVYTENNLYTCSNDTQERIKRIISENDLNRIVIASCSPRTHEPLFRNTCREGGLNPYLFEMANIRDQCSWVHMHDSTGATRKAKDLVRIAVAKARLLEPLRRGRVPVHKAALVMGGGLAGMVASLNLGDQGYDVTLVEGQSELGGNLRRLCFLMDGKDPRVELRSIVERVSRHPKIRLLTAARIESVEGSVGQFRTTIAQNGTTLPIEHGVVIVATGAREHRPSEYLYAEDRRVVTQLELEERIEQDGPSVVPDTVVMIQCVGSRNAERPYCSRVCCSEAVKNALVIKRIRPEANVYILYRDIRTYGFTEHLYSLARQKGVVFVRYDGDRPPIASKNGKRLDIEVHDPGIEKTFIIGADLLVLSTGVVPEEGNSEIAKLLKVPLTQEGFFLEAHMKLRPVDFATDGVFVCGLAHAAKTTEESIVQAGAAAARAGAILSKDHLETEATISFVIDENCDGCAYCIEPCPFQAVTLIEYMRDGDVKKVAEVNESICKGCGTCQATCPKRGITVYGFRLEQIEAQVSAALERIES